MCPRFTDMCLGRGAPRGISLIEILIVVAIIGILAAAVVPNLMSRPDEARVVAAKQDLSALSQALALYRMDNLSYPTQEQGLQALVSKPVMDPIPGNWKPGGYLRRLPQDPWGGDYLYLVSPDGQDVEIQTLGADRRKGGEGFAADLSTKGL